MLASRTHPEYFTYKKDNPVIEEGPKDTGLYLMDY